VSAETFHDESTVLRTSEVTVVYGGVYANQSVSLNVGRGEVVGLIGPNGAGKTTFIDAVSGFTPYAGEVWIGSTRVDGMTARGRHVAGLARTWQAGELFDELTVGENLAVATRPVGPRMVLRDLLRLGHVGGDPEIDAALAAVGLEHVKAMRPTDLPLGQLKLVGVARALASTPQVLLLDEPAAGLGTVGSRRLGERLREIAARGIGVLLVDHDMGLVLEVCDRVYVLDFGSVIAAGDSKEIVADPAVIEAYLGSADPELDEVAQ
jgi:ABC-type branched-subunit amino acid transport system ATPase component